MNLKEWIDLGVRNGVVDLSPVQELTFEEAYHRWFRMKLQMIRSQSCDRIECTWNRYYAASRLAAMKISGIDEAAVSGFLTDAIIGRGGITCKEYRRIFQIVNNVMVYARDLNLGGAGLLDWDRIRRYVPDDRFVVSGHRPCAVPRSDIRKMMRLVVEEKIYGIKQSACLCLMLNFYLGLRVGELASLTWQDVDPAEKVIHVHRTEIKTYSRDDSGNRTGTMIYCVAEGTKTVSSVREVPLLPEAVYLLEKLREHHNLRGYHSRYLAHDGSDSIRTRSLDCTLRRLCKLCEVNRFNTHAIRKTFATMLHMSGTPTRCISDLLGHSEMLTTERNYILNYRNNRSMLLEYMGDSLKF